MNAIIVFLIIDTVAQLFFCRFSLWWLIALICRILFGLRIIGVTIKVKKLAIAEGVVFCTMFLFKSLFHRGGMQWLRILVYLLFTLIAVGLEYLDDLLYVYVIEDLEED